MAIAMTTHLKQNKEVPIPLNLAKGKCEAKKRRFYVIQQTVIWGNALLQEMMLHEK